MNGRMFRLCRRPVQSVTLAALVIPAAGAVRADEWPSLRADISVELQDDYVFSASDAAAELNDTYATIDVELAWTLPEGTGIYASSTFEPVEDPDGDRFFRDEGLYLEEVYFGLAAGPGFLILGKFDPVFGTAGDNMPGIYGGDIAGDYELDERIGAAVSLPFEALGGEHTLSVATFVADTTALSGSLFTRRERLHRSDGGVSNTGRPESLAVALGGGFGGTGYNLGIRYQGIEGEDTAAEYGAVAGLAHEFEAGPAEIALFGEGAWFPDYDGATERAWFLTTGAEAGIGDFALSGVLGLGDTGAGPADRLATTTLEYVIADGLTASIGYRYLREDGVKSHTAGALLTWDFSLE